MKTLGSIVVNHSRPRNLIKNLRVKGLFTLGQVANANSSSIWSWEWMRAVDIGLQNEEPLMWKEYVANLKPSYVRFRESEDELTI